MSLRADLFEANSLSGSVRVLNGYANVELDVRPFALEGNISFIVDLRTGSTEGDILVSTPPIKLVDMSEVVSFTANNNVMNEGDLITFTLTTQNAANNAVVYYSTRSLVSNVNTLDFVGGNTGSITIVDNVGTVTLRANLDNSTIVETGEQFELEVRTGSPTGTVIANTTNSVTIADTSNAIAISAFSLSSNVTYETGQIIFRIDTRNAIGNAAATYYYTVTGNADLYTASSGEIVINDNTGYVNVITEASVSSNEVRNFTLQIRTGSVSGPIIYSTANVFVYDSTVTGMVAAGGNITVTDSHIIHTYANSDIFKIFQYSGIPQENNLEILLVAGGGGGAGDGPTFARGGGGAGGLLYYGSEVDPNKPPNGSSINAQTFGSNITSGSGISVIVGAAGAAGSGGGAGGAGSNTFLAVNGIRLNGFNAVFGGGGGSTVAPRRGGSSGGGGTSNDGTVESSPTAPEQGNWGGAGLGIGPTTAFSIAGGGGGAGANGTSYLGIPSVGNSVTYAANGGAGVYYTISGVGRWYAGGGGGSNKSTYQVGLGGSGVGGNGSNTTVSRTSGTILTGSGGGGGSGPLGSGGSGVAIIRYPKLFNQKISLIDAAIPDYAVTEKESNVTYSIITSMAANGEVFYYVTEGSVNSFLGANTGSFEVYGNAATIVITPNETGNVRLNILRGSTTGTVLVATANTQILNSLSEYLPNITGGTIIDVV